jgi:hypothetical protein
MKVLSVVNKKNDWNLVFSQKNTAKDKETLINSIYSRSYSADTFPIKIFSKHHLSSCHNGLISFEDCYSVFKILFISVIYVTISPFERLLC